ncbi:hypothetical protein Tco_1280137 [Tanacetum coccineum]
MMTWSISDGDIYVCFIIRGQLFSYPLSEFDQILRILTSGLCAFSDEWTLDSLSLASPYYGRYASTPISPEDIKLIIQQPREGPVTRRIKREDRAKIIRENAFCLGGNRDHVPACLVLMLYCVATSTPLNLAYFIARRTELATFKPKLNLPYGMLLTRLFKRVQCYYPYLFTKGYDLVDRVTLPLEREPQRKTRSDLGARRSVHGYSSFRLKHGSSSHQLDDEEDENADEGSPSKSFPSHFSYVDSLPQNTRLNFARSSSTTITLESIYEQNNALREENYHIGEEVRGGFKSIGKAFKKLMGKG